MIQSDGLQWGSWLDWGMLLTIGIAVTILGGIVGSLVIFRGRQTEGNALWLHLLSLGILPLLLLAVGNFTSLEYAKEVQFCGSCHRTMQPYIDDMRRDHSRSQPRSTSVVVAVAAMAAVVEKKEWLLPSVPAWRRGKKFWLRPLPTTFPVRVA